MGKTGASVHSAAGTRSSMRSVTLVAGAGGKFYDSAQTINAIRTCGTKSTATGHIHTYIVYIPNADAFDVAG